MQWNSFRVETWRDVMEWNVLLYPNKIAFSDVATNRQWTFKEQNEVVNRLCNALYGMGLAKGDRVAVLAGDLIEFTQIAMVCKAGLVYVPINWRLKANEITHIINDSGAKVLFVDGDHVEVAREMKNDIPGVKHLICINASPEGMLNFYDLIASASDEDPGVDVVETDLLGIPYTSGTSALPKGVVRRHVDVIKSGVVQIVSAHYNPDDIFLGVIPLFHVAMLHVQFSLYRVGATQYIMRFEPQAVLEIMQKHKITAFAGVPTMVINLMEHPDFDKFDLSSLRFLLYTGSPMHPKIARKAWNSFGPILHQMYGATEGGGTLLLPEDHAKAFEDPARERLLSSAGKVMVGAELKIVDDDGNLVPPGTMGEICFNTANMPDSYWNLPEETAETFKDGWFHTGDVGEMDEENYVYIMDRKKDVIVSGAENISAREIEGVIMGLPAVLECAVIGIPHEKWGEEVKAIVVPKKGMTITPDEVVEYCRENMAGYKRPKTAEIWDELPKNPTGKILKKDIKEKYWGGEARRVS